MAGAEETRNALWRREEQLVRWRESETANQSSDPRNQFNSKIKFQDGCVFLAACASGDTEEVEKLLKRGADINTSNIDGLTALHQACIDNNEDMVKFLVQLGSDIDAADNEGWTALHATASCGFIEIARYLIEQNANIAAVNNDGELAIDISEGDDMEQLLSDEMESQGIDAEAARNEEEEMMLRHANQWLNNGIYDEKPHPKTGAYALHVAAAKGYIKVMKLFIQAGADLEAKDQDGWTALHAAAHWGQEEACKILVDNFCNMEAHNNVGQTAFDLADSGVLPQLEELKKMQALLKKDREDKPKEITIKGMPPPLKRRSSVTRMSADQKQNLGLKNVEEERAQLEAMRHNVVEEKEEEKEEERKSEASSTETEEESDEEVTSSSEEESSESETSKQNQKNRQSTLSNKGQVNGVTPEKHKPVPETTPKIEQAQEIQEIKPPPPRVSQTPRITDLAKTQEQRKEDDKENETDRDKELARNRERLLRNKEEKKEEKKEDKPSENEKSNRIQNRQILGRTVSAPPVTTPSTVGRQVSSLTSRSSVSRIDSSKSSHTEDPTSWRAGLRKTGSSSAVPENTNNKEPDKLPRSLSSSWISSDRNDDLTRRRIHSSTVSGDNQETNRNRYNDIYSRYTSLGNINRSNTTTTTPYTSSMFNKTPSYQSSLLLRRRTLETEDKENEKRDSRRDLELRKDRDRSSILSSITSTASTSGTITGTTTGSGQRRSFEPPKRDEEKEVERKARAKRARETRRSTQGVTKEDLERAEATLREANNADLALQTSRAAADQAAQDQTDSSKHGQPERQSSLKARLAGALEEQQEDDKRTSLRRLRDLGVTEANSSYLRNTLNYTTPSSITRDSSTSSVTATTTTSSTSVSTTTTTTTPYTRSSARTSYKSPFRNEDSSQKTEVKSRGSRLGVKDEKEDPSQKSSAIRTRRKREHRRPTGNVTAEDLQNLTKEQDEGENESTEPKKEEDRTSSRYSSRYSEPSGYTPYDTSSKYTSRSDRPSSYSDRLYPKSYSSSSSSLDSKEIDYKKLYDEEKSENEKLRKEIERLKSDLSENKSDLERARQKNESVRPYESSADKREKRALERRISEIEEELKQMANLKADNQRLKDENGALIRVISKLSK